MVNVLLSQNNAAVKLLSSTMTAIAKNIAEIIAIISQFIINGRSSFTHLKAYQVDNISTAKEIYLFKY